MEPLSALGVATAVVQFLDFTGKVVAGTYRIHTGKRDDKNTALDDVTASLVRVTTQLGNTLGCADPASLTQCDQDILQLGKNCNDLGTRILSTLAKLNKSPEEEVTIFTSFRAALLTVWKRSEFDSLCQELERHRSQISLLILASVREQVAASAKAQDRNLQETKDLCQKVLDHLESAGDHFADTQLPAASLQLPSSDQYNEEVTIRVQNMILRSLHFREIDHRYERIAYAHRETFDWIYNTSSIAKFPQWLRDEDASLYWITGKPGSGKSTLMKYIFDTERTQRMLTAGLYGKSLIMASIYIWNSGTQMQMSYEGVVQSLLYQILHAQPDLMPVVFPHWFEVGALLGDRIGKANRMVWVWEDLNKALRSTLVEAAKLHKIVVFIDGLDEFSGKPSDMVSFITTLTSSNAKLCVSSRPWVAFEDAFGCRPHLRMQDLTQKDIKHYVASQLKDNEGFKVMEIVHARFCANLVDDVCDKSSGVFLWVVLVTFSLLEGLTDGENVVELQRRFDSLPSDLEKLFWSILNGLDKRKFSHACQLLKIYRHAESTLTVLDMSFAESIDGDPDFALNAPIELWTERTKQARGDLMRRRMTASCKGLLEATGKDQRLSYQDNINYLHRTVKDFVEQPNVWSDICIAAGSDLNHYEALFNAQLMRLKISSFANATLKNIWDIFLLAIAYAAQASPDGSWRQMQLLNELDAAIDKVMDTPYKSDVTEFMEGLRWLRIYEWRNMNMSQPTILELAVRFQLAGYVTACLEAVSKHQATLEASQLLIGAVAYNKINKINQADIPKILYHESISRETVQVLLQHADLNRVFKGTSSWSQLLLRCDTEEMFDIAKDFLNAGADPRLSYLDDPKLKSRMPEDFKALLKQKRRATRWAHYAGSSSSLGRG